MVRQPEASRAQTDTLFHFEQRFGQRDHLVARPIEQIEHHPSRGLLADSGQPRQLFDKPRHRRRQSVLPLQGFRHPALRHSVPRPGIGTPWRGPNLPISWASILCARAIPSLTATRIRSSSIDLSLAATIAASISILRRRSEPSTTTRTIPPPD